MINPMVKYSRCVQGQYGAGSGAELTPYVAGYGCVIPLTPPCSGWNPYGYY